MQRRHGGVTWGLIRPGERIAGSITVIGMIDKLEVRIPRETEFSDEVRKLFGEICRQPTAGTGRYYRNAVDLRPFGHSSLLHMECKWPGNGNHKLELLDTGSMTYTEMQGEIERVVAGDSAKLRVMRVDLAADVEGVSVPWFVRHVRAANKRFNCDIGQYTCMGKPEPQTVYLGMRPNCYRIYDKIAEWRQRFAQFRRRNRNTGQLPSFQDVFGYPETGVTLTRVERQMGGGRIPAQLATFGHLRSSPSFNPFEKLDVVGRAPELSIDDRAGGATEILAGIGLCQIVQEWGIHRARSFVNKHSGGHASRIFRDYSQFLPAEVGITAEDLYCRYKESVSRQLAA